MQFSLARAFTALHVRATFPVLAASCSAGRKLYDGLERVREPFRVRPPHAPALPDRYRAHNTRTSDGERELACVGEVPKELSGTLYMAQSLGTPRTFQCGDMNLVRLAFADGRVSQRDRRLDTPAVIARHALARTRYGMEFFGYLHWSFALGAQAYAEGVHLMPDGQLLVTSDVERPYLVDPVTLAVTSALGRRDEWLSLAKEPAATLLGKLFPLTSTCQGAFHDHETNELFLADYRLKNADPAHPVRVLRKRADGPLVAYPLITRTGEPLEITQSLHELAVTRAHVILVDTGFAAGNELFFPWRDLPAPSPRTRIHVLRRADLEHGPHPVHVQSFDVDLPAIHLFANYETPDDCITLHLLHTPGTNVADVIRPDDVDLDGAPFPAHAIGYGTLPPLDVSAFGTVELDLRQGTVRAQRLLRDPARTFAPYMVTLPGRHVRHFDGGDAYVLFRGYARSLVPRRVVQATRDAPARLRHELTRPGAPDVPASLCRIDCRGPSLGDAYTFPARTLCFSVCALGDAFLLASVVSDQPASPASSGHEHWLFDARDLARGPLAKLVHPSLDNHTLFHGLFVPFGPELLARRGDAGRYRLDVREDYPAAELALYPAAVRDVFRERIYPRFCP